MTYKNGEWEHCYVMQGCIDFKLLKQVTNETEEIANRADGASVKTDCQLRGGLPQIHLRTDGVE